MSAALATLSVNNILSFNGHGGKITSGDNQTFTLPGNVYVLVPFGIDVDGVNKPNSSGTQKTDKNFKGLDVCYTTPAPTPSAKLTFEEIIYGKPGKIKFTFSSNVDARWHLYKPGDQVPNVEYHSFNPSGDAAGGTAQSCDDVSKNYKNYISDLMNACLNSGNDLNKKVCAYFVSKSDPSHEVFIDSAGKYHLKLKICGDGKTATTTLEELANNCHKLVEFSRNYVKTNKKSGGTYLHGYEDDKILPKSGNDDPIILLPFICNSCNSGNDIQLGHNYTNDNSEASLKPLSDIIAELSGGGGGGGGGGGSGDPPSGKVAQFFMIFKDGSNGGLNSYQQCKKIVDVVKCLIAKRYENIGLTYSANQAQTIKIWEKYKYDVTKPYDWTSNSFDTGESKTIADTEISGDNQAEALGPYHEKKQNVETGKWEIYGSKLPPRIDTITGKNNDEDFGKVFRIIPFTTMQEGGGDLIESNLGNNSQCIKAAEDFLKLPKSIILGWCNQSCSNMNDAADKIKQKFAIGGGVAKSYTNANNIYIPQYLKFLTSKWDPKVQEIVTECSPNPKSADPTGSSPPATPPVVTQKFDDVLTNLQDKITLEGDTSADIAKLSITDPGLFYPTTEAEPPKKKNLNCAIPLIKDMITAFETADGGERDFYLGACKSIQAAYELDMNSVTAESQEAMRAKLLLNLRKNSLLLKVPARWDYAEMKLGVEVVPELTRKPIISKPIIPMELNDTTKNDIIKKLVQDFDFFKNKNPGKDTIDAMVNANEILNNIYTNRYTTLLNDISYLNYNLRPSTSASNSLIFQLLAYESVNRLYPSATSLSNLLEYFTSKQAIENIDEYLKTNISAIVNKINEKIQHTSDDSTKALYSNFYKFLLETKRIDILEYILSEHENASGFSGVIRPYYEDILKKEKKSIDEMLKSVGYIFKSGYGDGNCFYNSAGMQLIKPPVDYKQYNSVDRFSELWWKPQNEKQSKLRTELAEFLSKIYNKVKDFKEFKESQLEFIKYLQKYGPNNFDNVSTIKTPIDSYYWGTDDELFYISLLYDCFVVILSPGSQEFQTIEYITPDNIDSSDAANTFKIISDPTRNNYNADGLKSALSSNKKPVVFMVGGRGHWDYAISSTLNQSGGSNNIPRPITYTNTANTNNTASKSKHNSSFKASSSKTKGKGHNRSHTQRVK